ncbi:hypothetical protein [Salarchaeum japonicum]|uniref:hypothetical protein n=1 Tax=Salarchaeum japonicum TaxID=555573 RepID=UPI003C752C44
MSACDSSHDTGAQPAKIVAANLRSPYARAHTGDIPVLVASDVEREYVHPTDSTDIDPIHVGDPVGITVSGETAVAEEGDGALTKAEALKDRADTVLGPQWGDGRTTWHPNDITARPSDHNTGAAISAIKSERHKQEVRRLFGSDSWLKRLNDGTASDDEGNRHERDVRQRITAFCEQLDFHAHESQVISVYNALPAEPFHPIGGHEPAECQAPRPVNWVISDVHPPENGAMDVATSSEYSWDVEYTPVKHDPSMCPYCHQCQCGNYHFGDAPKNGVETRILAAMLLVDEQRIKAAEDSQAAFNNWLKERDGYNELVTRHALNPMQALQTARNHYNTDDG